MSGLSCRLFSVIYKAALNEHLEYVLGYNSLHYL